MRIFKGGDDRGGEHFAEAYSEALRQGFVESCELDALCRILNRNGVEHSHQGGGAYRRITFDCPHGTVTVSAGPGTNGYELGLVEPYCKGWDMSPRRGMTAKQVYAEYMHGGW